MDLAPLGFLYKGVRSERYMSHWVGKAPRLPRECPLHDLRMDRSAVLSILRTLGHSAACTVVSCSAGLVFQPEAPSAPSVLLGPLQLLLSTESSF